jgi:hypothetical protein
MQEHQEVSRLGADTTRARLAAIAAGYADTGLIIDSRGALGRPRDEIARAASDANARLIVVGSLSRSGFTRRLGSHPQHLLRTAPCPVLIARATTPSSAKTLERSEVGALRWQRTNCVARASPTQALPEGASPSLRK